MYCKVNSSQVAVGGSPLPCHNTSTLPSFVTVVHRRRLSVSARPSEFVSQEYTQSFGSNGPGECSRPKIIEFTLGRHVCRPKWSCVLTSISLIQTEILFAGNRPSVLMFDTRRGIIQLSRLVFALARKHMTQTQRVWHRSSRVSSCEQG